jgi:hypothetical protein
MLVNISYNNKEIIRNVEDAVGKPFKLKERWQMKGIGSPKLHIKQASIEIRTLLLLDNNMDCCNIEMRPKGIIVGFRSLLESYALVIPYHKLTIFKGEASLYSIHCDNRFIKVEAKTKAVHRFFKKLLDYKTDNSPKFIENL